MRIDEHIAVAAESLRRGLIDQKTLEEAVDTVLASGASPRGEDLWLDKGWLSRTDLSDILRAIRPTATPSPSTSSSQPTAVGLRRSTPGSQPKLKHDKTASSGYDTTVERQPHEITQRSAKLPTESDLAAFVSDETIPPEALATPSMLTQLSQRLAFEKWQTSVTERYKATELLGRGGLGEVMRCADALLGRTVALKAARPERGAAGHAIIEHEARIIASLEHPNIVPAYDAGFSPARGPFYVMRVLTQSSLDQVLNGLRDGDEDVVTEFSQSRLLRHFIQVCHAAEYAHQRGIVHCDLKPENILLGDFGEVLIVDWGLAFSKESESCVRGGTPGYMAPEQFVPEANPIDGRTDVFALGAVLYRIVALTPAFPDVRAMNSEMKRGLLDIYAAVIPPSERAPDRHVPPALDEICLRALKVDPEQRYPSARALAAEVEAYVEGRKELERRTAEAEKCVENARDLATRYHESVDARPILVGALHEVQRTTPPWAPSDLKHDLWDAQDVLRVTDSLRRRMFQTAVAAYEQALDLVPTLPDARSGIVALYRAELERARRERDDIDIVHFSRLLRMHDESFKVARPTGSLRVEVAEAVTPVLYRLAHMERRCQPERMRTFEPGSTTLDLSPGFYLLRADAPGRADAGYPLVVEAGEEISLRIDPPPRDAICDDEVFISGGPAFLGETGLHGVLREPTEVQVDAFAIGRLPVTFREYLAFVSAIRESDAARAERVLPRTVLDNPRWSLVREGWKATGFADDRNAEELLDLPVFGISFDDATAYASWMAARTGRGYRLPGDSEWEKAGRGTDGRVYPWGNQFDATFCKMRYSKRGRSYPERSGLFEADESPYGVRDLAGGIADWVVPDPRSATFQSDEHRIAFSRGGAWCDWEEDCRLTFRREYLCDEVTSRVGFRLARSLPDDRSDK